MKRLAFVAAVLLLFPFVFSLTCKDIPAKYNNECIGIMQSDAPQEQKEYLAVNLMNDNILIPSHDFTKSWNEKIVFSEAPASVPVFGSGSIKDAWVKIIEISPSILYEDKLLSPGYGEVLSAYNYNIELPENIEYGDCDTKYSLLDKSDKFSVYLNEEKIGSDKKLEFTGSGIFKSVLDIQAKTEVTHFKLKRYCCSFSNNGGCIKYCTKCEQYNTEIRTDNLEIKDTMQTEFFQSDINPNFEVLESNKEIAQGLLKIDDYSSFKLSFKDSSYERYSYSYDFVLSLVPYNVITIMANDAPSEAITNMNLENYEGQFRFYTPTFENCNLLYRDHFNSWNIPCNLNFNLPELKIDTDKLSYEENEPIEVSLKPGNSEFLVSYGLEKKQATDSTVFTADQKYNRITASLGNRKAEKTIHVKSPFVWNFVLNFGVFSGILYFFYAIIKKCFGGIF